MNYSDALPTRNQRLMKIKKFGDPICQIDR